jgi:hypothetical protein
MVAPIHIELRIEVHYTTSLAQVQTSSQKEDFHYLHHTNNTKGAETFPAWDDQVQVTYKKEYGVKKDAQ